MGSCCVIGVSGTGTEDFEAGGVCHLERGAFDEVARSLTEEYVLDAAADRLLVKRAAIYLIRLARADAYEAWI